MIANEMDVRILLARFEGVATGEGSIALVGLETQAAVYLSRP
jgi:hypothetical protein